MNRLRTGIVAGAAAGGLLGGAVGHARAEAGNHGTMEGIGAIQADVAAAHVAYDTLVTIDPANPVLQCEVDALKLIKDEHYRDPLSVEPHHEAFNAEEITGVLDQKCEEGAKLGTLHVDLGRQAAEHLAIIYYKPEHTQDVRDAFVLTTTERAQGAFAGAGIALLALAGPAVWGWRRSEDSSIRSLRKAGKPGGATPPPPPPPPVDHRDKTGETAIAPRGH